MNVTDIYKRLWHAPDGHTYFGLFTDDYKDHLFDVSKFLETLYMIAPPEQVSKDISRLIIAYIIAATTHDVETDETEDINNVVVPVDWFVKHIRHCIIYEEDIIWQYKRAMGLPVEAGDISIKRYGYLNGIV